MRDARRPVEVENPDGVGPFVIACDHASNRIPDDCQSFGFEQDALATHIAWDPGALGVARRLSALLDAPLLWPDVSRLVIDCNRAADSATLIVTQSEGRKVEANLAVTAAERARRLTEIHAPFHDAIDACLKRKLASGQMPAVVAVHSYTPVFLGNARPWPIGILFDHERRLADHLIAGLKSNASLNVGINQPYSPADQVYYTVARHAHAYGLPAVMIEIRNDEIATASGQRAWAERLGDLFLSVEPDLVATREAV